METEIEIEIGMEIEKLFFLFAFLRDYSISFFRYLFLLSLSLSLFPPPINPSVSHYLPLSPLIWSLRYVSRIRYRRGITLLTSTLRYQKTYIDKRNRLLLQDLTRNVILHAHLRIICYMYIYRSSLASNNPYKIRSLGI